MGKFKKIYLIFIFLQISNLFASEKDIVIENKHANKIPIFDYVYVFEDTSNAYYINKLIRPKHSHLFRLNTKQNITPGFTNSSYWLRFSMINKTEEDQNFVFCLSYPLIKDVRFYVYKNNTIQQVVQTGDSKKFSSRDITYKDFVFELKLEPNKRYTYYLYAYNYGETLRLPISLYTQNEFISNNTWKSLLTGIFYGLLIFVLIFNLFLYYSIKERLYLYYSFYVFFIGIFLCNLDGLSFQYFWPNSPWFGNHSTIFSTSLANFFLLLFSKSFLNTWKFSPLFDKIIKGLMVLVLAIFLLALFNGKTYLYAVIMANLFSMLTILTVMIAAFYSLSSKNAPAFYFILSFFIFMISVVIYVMRNIGVFSDNVFTTYILKFGFSSELLLLTFAITDRFRRMKDVVNQELEKVVQLKTEEIKSQNEEIKQQSEHLQSVNHELELLSIVVSEADNGVTIFSPEGIIEWQNKGFHKLYGYSYEDKLLLKSANAFELSDNEKFTFFFRKAVKLKKSITYKTNTINRKGVNIWVQTTLTPITDNEGKIIKFIAFDTNITHVKTTEEELKRKNLDITSSIITAQRIQKAILPPKHLIRKWFPETMVFLKPKDIVSGDFYWFNRKDHNMFFSAVDCTGHGVPGAFMSIVGYNLLNHAIKERLLTKPADILNYLNIAVNRMLKQGASKISGNEGMDLALCTFNFEKNILQYAGSRNPLYLFRKGKLIEIKGDNYSVGIFYDQKYRKFTNHEIEIQPNDRIYLFSDGFADQFGGNYRKKYMKKNFKRLLTEIQDLSLPEQKEKIIEEFNNWKGPFDQLDDVLVMGIRLI